MLYFHDVQSTYPSAHPASGTNRASSPCLNPLVFTRRQSVRICLCEPENKIERVEERRWWPEKIFTGFKGSENHQNDLGGPVMSCPGLARTISRAQQEREVARRGLDQALFVHVLQSPYPQPIQSAGVELMREVPLDPLASLPLQSLATSTCDPPPVAVDGCLLRIFAVPVARSAIRLGHVRPHLQFGQSHHHIVAVIALVGDQLLHAFRMDFILAFWRLLSDQ